MISLETNSSIRGSLFTTGDGGKASLPISESLIKSIGNGIGLDQANAVYIDEFSIAASGSLNIDLSGTLVDRLGNPVVFTAIKEILVIADAANVNDLVYGNGATPFIGPLNVGTATVSLKPGNDFHVTNYSAAGWAVVAATADILKLANGGAGTPVTGTIVIVGLA